MFPFNPAPTPDFGPKRQRPELPLASPRLDGVYTGDEGGAGGPEYVDFRFHDIDTEPDTRMRKVAVPRSSPETSTNGQELFTPVPVSRFMNRISPHDPFKLVLTRNGFKSAPDFDPEDLAAWCSFVEERLGKLQNILSDVRNLFDQRRAAASPGRTQDLHDGLLFLVSSEHAHLQYALGQSVPSRLWDRARKDHFSTSSRYRLPMRRCKMVRRAIEQVASILGDCYKELAATGTSGGGFSADEMTVLGMLDTARQNLELAINSKEYSLVTNRARVRNKRPDCNHEAEPSAKTT